MGQKLKSVIKDYNTVHKLKIPRYSVLVHESKHEMICIFFKVYNSSFEFPKQILDISEDTQ